MKKKIGDLKLDDFAEGCIRYNSLPKPVNYMTCDFCDFRKICEALFKLNLEEEIEVEVNENNTRC